MAGFSVMASPVVLWLPVLLAVGYATYVDNRTRRVPNWIGLPVLFVGLIAAFPGTPVLWIFAVTMFAAWKAGIVGGGDAKLWIGLVWLASVLFRGARVGVYGGDLAAAVLAALLMMITSLLQRLLGRYRPGYHPDAWRALVYALVAAVVMVV